MSNPQPGRGLEKDVCQCEHTKHFSDGGRTTPIDGGSWGHRYGARCASTVAIKTIYGTFNVCPECAEGCYEIKYRKEPHHG